MNIPFGKPFPGIDSVSLRDGVASGLVNGYINPLGDYQKVPGHTLFATHSDAASVGSLYETLSGVILGVTNGKVVLLNSNGTFTAFTGDTVTVGTYYYWAEDGQHVYLSHGAKLARIDTTNLIVTLLNENSPSAVTHVARAKGFLLTNGNDFVNTSSGFAISQVFDITADLRDIVTLTDKTGWILASGSRTSSPGAGGTIYLSKDNGISWTKVYTATGNNFIMGLGYMGSGVVLAGTGTTTGKILRSTDYGATWADLGTQGASTTIWWVAKVDTNIAIAGAGSGGAATGIVFRSTDNGATWAAIATPATFGQRVQSVIVWSTTVVTVGTLNAGATAVHIWRSTDAGATFTDIATLDSGFSIEGLKVSSTIGLTSVHVTGPTTKVYRSTDTGATWATIGTIDKLAAGALVYPLVYLSTGDLLFGTSGDAITAGGGAQIWKSTDLGVRWDKVADLDTGMQAAALALAETHTPGQLIVGGRTLLSTATTANAAKWQTGVGSTAPQGDVFFSEDVSNNYQAVDSWERFNAQSGPDGVTGIFAHQGLVYASGPRSIEINYNSGDATLPWAVSDPSLPFGLMAPFSWVQFDEIDTAMYLSVTDNTVEVVKFNGRQQHTISNEYASVLNDGAVVTSPTTAKAWGVVILGVPHYVLTFPSDNLTICYNLISDHWWRWAYWNGTTYESAIINSYVYSKTLNKHFIGDRRANGRVYTLSGLTDNAQAIRFELTGGHVASGSFFPKQVGRVIFKIKRGQATDSSTPVFTYQTRDNGNPAFSTARSVSLGITGETEFLGYLNRCGMYQTRQSRIVHIDTVSDFIFSEADES